MVPRDIFSTHIWEKLNLWSKLNSEKNEIFITVTMKSFRETFAEMYH